MKNNVLLEHFVHGTLVGTTELHNTWVRDGSAYLANMVSYQVISDMGDVPQETARVKYLGIGIGSKDAAASAFGPVLMDAYPPGYDGYESNGNLYNKDTPLDPVIMNLERPVRRSGSVDPYPVATNTDTWLVLGEGPFYRDINSVTHKFTVDASAGDWVYGSLPPLPITEAGLFLSTADVHLPYNHLVAYINFDSITLRAGSVLKFTWTVRFAP